MVRVCLNTIVPVLIAFILIGCLSTSVSDSEKNEILAELLTEMMSVKPYPDISPRLIASSLPEEYKSYSSLVPLYDEIEESYASKVSSAVSPLLDDADALILSFSPQIIAGLGIDALGFEPSLTEALKATLYNQVKDIFYQSLTEVEEEIDKAYEESEELFDSVRNSYIILEKVGYVRNINQSMPISKEVLSGLMADYLFSLLAGREIAVKNLPEFGGK